jgi:hypothetical protein
LFHHARDCYQRDADIAGLGHGMTPLALRVDDANYFIYQHLSDSKAISATDLPADAC